MSTTKTDISKQKKPPNTLVSPLILLEPGKQMESSQPLEQIHSLDTDDMIYNRLKNQDGIYLSLKKHYKFKPQINQFQQLIQNLLPKEKSAIVESLLNIKNPTLITKFLLSNHYTQTMKLFQILGLGLTSSVRGFKGCSLTCLRELSNRLLLPTKTDCVGLALTSSNGFATSSMFNSWFSTVPQMIRMNSSVKTSCPSYISSPVKSMVVEDTEEEKQEDEKKENKQKKKTKKKKTPTKNNDKPKNDKKCSFFVVKDDIGKRCNKLSPTDICKKHKDKIQEEFYYQEMTVDDPDFKICNFVSVSKGKTTPCGFISLSNSTRCKKHLSTKQKKYNDDDIVDDTCPFIMTQYARKGLPCGDKLVEGKKYCKSHVKRVSYGELQRTFKLRVYPPKDYNVLSKWFGDSRKTFNLCKTDNENDKSNDFLRNKYVINPSSEFNYLLGTPKEIRAASVREYLTSYETNMDKRNRTGKNFNIKFKSKKKQQCITIPKESIKICKEKTYYNRNNKIVNVHSISMYPTYIPENFNLRGKTSSKDKKWNKLIAEVGVFYHDVKLIKTISCKYYLCITVDVNKKNIPLKNEVVSDDPGGNSFATTFSTDNKMIDMDIKNRYPTYRSNKEKLISYFKEIDGLKSLRDNKDYKKIDKEEEKNRKIKLNHKIKIKEEKIRNRIADMHYKLATYLTQYKDIVIPNFGVKQMISKEKYLSKVNRRALQCLSHYKFRVRLISKASETGSEVNICEESYTSMLCTRCFHPKKENGRDKLCSKCGLFILRDYNGARNILLKFILCKLIASIIKEKTEVFLDEQKGFLEGCLKQD